MEDSHLHGLHTQGLSACSSLRLLQLSQSVIFDQNHDLQLLTNLSIMPLGRPLSSQLHTLHLLTDNDQTESLAVNWIHELSSLKDIAIKCNYCNLDLMVCLTNLTNLTKLIVQGDLFTCISLDIEWHHLQALQFLSIEGFTVVCGQRLVSLLQLERLTHVCFDGITPKDSRCSAFLAALVYNLATLRPQTKLRLNEVAALDYPGL